MYTRLNDAFENKEQNMAYEASAYKRLKAKIKKTKLSKAFDQMVAVEPGCSIYVGAYTVYLDVPVKSMKHMAEVLEFLQAELGMEFDKSGDYPGGGYRMFTSTNQDFLWLNVRAMVHQNDEDDGALCKRVITGYKTVEQPVYKLECKDAAE